MAISTAAQTAFDRLTQSWGQPLSVTSGYRDPAYNASVGGARNSQHTHGNAFDIDVSGMSPEQRLALATAARNAGFQGFGFYDNSLHFDVGAPRAWGPSYHRDSLPGWAADWVGQNVGGGTAGGGNNLTMSTSGDKTMGLLDMQDEPQTFGQRLKSGMKDGRVLDAIALAANSLRMRPDENINQMVGMRQQQRQDAQTANRTSQWLASIGRTDLAQALATGALDAKSAVALAMQPAKERSAVEVGGKLVDPQTGEVIYDSGVSPTTGTDDMREYDAAVAQGFKGTFIDYMTAMKTAGVAPTTGTDDMREYDAAVAQGFKGTFMDYLTTVKKAGAPTTTMPAGETAYDKTLGEWGAKSYTTLQDSAAAALDQIGNLSYMESLMADPNFRTGTGTEAIISMRKLVEAMGGNPAEVGSIEAFRGATAQAVLGQMGGSLGAGFSNADRSFVESMAANLDNSLQGNKLVINAQRKVAQRKVELARLADQYIAEKGRLDAGWPQYMRAYAEQNPLFGGAGADPLSYVTGGGN